MGKAIIDESTLTNLANKIRVLNDTEESMTPVQMNSELASANDEVDAQSALIEQLSELLDGKASGGGKIETCTVSFPESFSYHSDICYLGSDLTAKRFTLGQPGTISVIKNSIISIDHTASDSVSFYSHLRSDLGALYISEMSRNSDYYLSCIITDNATFYFYGSSEVT